MNWEIAGKKLVKLITRQAFQETEENIDTTKITEYQKGCIETKNIIFYKMLNILKECDEL